MTLYLGTNATPQERIEHGECQEVWPAVEELIEAADPEYGEKLEGEIDHVEEILHDIRKQLESNSKTSRDYASYSTNY